MTKVSRALHGKSSSFNTKPPYATVPSCCDPRLARYLSQTPTPSPLSACLCLYPEKHFFCLIYFEMSPKAAVTPGHRPQTRSQAAEAELSPGLEFPVRRRTPGVGAETSPTPKPRNTEKLREQTLPNSSFAGRSERNSTSSSRASTRSRDSTPASFVSARSTAGSRSNFSKSPTPGSFYSACSARDKTPSSSSSYTSPRYSSSSGASSSSSWSSSTNTSTSSEFSDYSSHPSTPSVSSSTSSGISSTVPPSPAPWRYDTMDPPADPSIFSIFLLRLHDSYLRSILAFWPLLFYAFYQSRHWMSDPSILYPHNITIVEALLEFIFKVHIFLRGALVALWVFRLLRSPWTKDKPLLSPIWPDEPIATSHPPNAFTAWLAHARANPHLNPPVSLNSGLPYGFDYNQLDDNNHTFKIYFDYMPSHIRMQWERSAFEALEAYTTQRAYHLRHIRTHLDSALFRAFPPLRSIFPSPSPSRLARALHTFKTIPWSTLFRSLLLMYIPFWGPNTLPWLVGQTIALILITHVYESLAMRKVDTVMRKC